MRPQKFLYLTIFLLFTTSCFHKTKTKIANQGYIEFQVQELVDNNYNLAGEWELYPNKILHNKDFDTIRTPKYIYIPSYKTKINPEGLDTGYATYRLRIKLPEKGLYATKYGFLYTACNVYLNDKLIFKQGVFATNSTNSRAKYGFGYFPIVVDSLNADSTISLVFHFSDFSSSKKFGITKPLIFGKFNNIESRYNIMLLFLYLVLGVLTIMFIYNIFIFIFYPRNISILFFALLTIAIAIRSFVTSSIFMPLLDFSISLRVSFLSAVFFVLFTLLFYMSFFKNFISKTLFYISLVYSLLLTLFYVFSPIYYLDNSVLFLYFYIFVLNTYFLVKLLIMSFQRVQNSLLVFLAQLIFYVSMLNDMMFYLRIVDWGYVAHYTISIFVAIEAIVIARSLSKIYKTNLLLYEELDYQNKNLEFLVKQRTKEIEEKNKELLKLSLIAEKSHNVIIVFNRNFDLIWANHQFEIFYNTKFNEAYKKINLIKDSGNKNIKKIVEKVLEGNSVTYVSKCYKPKTRRWAQTTLSPLIINNEVNEIIAIESDITKIKKIERKLLEQNIAIRDSLKYALTIQSSILPSDIGMYFKNFLYYKPKEIVSGDFYYFKKLMNTENPSFIIGVIDCTGHGVPGAFMSLIISQLLDQIINNEHITEPSQILNLLNSRLKNFLNKNIDIENSDGAAISLLNIVKFENHFEVVYSTANLSFFVFHRKNKHLNQYKTNVSHIGWYFNEENIYKQDRLKLNKGDIIYLFSDGYYDQINPNRKKFGKKNFYDLILLVSELSFETQRIIIEDNFQKWKKSQDQYDDILILALEMN